MLLRGPATVDRGIAAPAMLWAGGASQYESADLLGLRHPLAWLLLHKQTYDLASAGLVDRIWTRLPGPIVISR
jgi:hypothetical protein